jgi:hypothetical protein
MVDLEHVEDHERQRTARAVEESLADEREVRVGFVNSVVADFQGKP